MTINTPEVEWLIVQTKCYSRFWDAPFLFSTCSPVHWRTLLGLAQLWGVLDDILYSPWIETRGLPDGRTIGVHMGLAVESCGKRRSHGRTPFHTVASIWYLVSFWAYLIIQAVFIFNLLRDERVVPSLLWLVPQALPLIRLKNKMVADHPWYYPPCSDTLQLSRRTSGSRRRWRPP